MFLGAPVDDNPARVLREREIRDRLASMSPTDRFEVFRHAVESGDSLVFDAFANAPKFFNLVGAEALEQSKQAWFEKDNPQLARELAQVRLMDDVLTENLVDVRSAVNELTGTEASLRQRMQPVPA